MLRRATLGDVPFVARLWLDPAHAFALMPPEDRTFGLAIEEERLLIWDSPAGPLGFASLTKWQDRVWSIDAIACAPEGKGQGRAFLSAVLDDLFHRRHAHRVALDAAADNHSAQRLFRNLGFVQEGVWRQGWQRPDGAWVDCPFFALLSDEWRAPS